VLLILTPPVYHFIFYVITLFVFLTKITTAITLCHYEGFQIDIPFQGLIDFYRYEDNNEV
ncbi:MAG: hypothetical protein D6778_04615, partial [Nitrospirae bacterium]